MKKKGNELLSIDVYAKENLRSRKHVFVGSKCAKLMKSLDLTPTSSQLDEFYEKVFRFHQKAANKLQEYFETG